MGARSDAGRPMAQRIYGDEYAHASQDPKAFQTQKFQSADTGGWAGCPSARGDSEIVSSRQGANEDRRIAVDGKRGGQDCAECRHAGILFAQPPAE